MSLQPDAPQWGLATAELDWSDPAGPRSTRFGDVYFSRDGGPAETRHTFINGNRLEERWSTLPADRPGSFVIAETGFGTGLNFLCASQLWERLAPPGWHLHYVSAEAAPLRDADLRRAHQGWPEFAALSARLCALYPPPVPGFHRLAIAPGRVTLTLLHGDAAEQFAALEARVDAWFLDGFAPACNPGAWDASLFSQVARLSGPGTTCASFTVARGVREQLTEGGFTVSREPGFGRKRQMLHALRHGPEPQRPHRPRRALVIGAGLAGCMTAHALASRGLGVRVLEAGPGPASGASGNPFAVLYAKLSPFPTPHARFQVAAYLHALRHLEDLHRARDEIQVMRDAACGVLQLGDAAQTAKWERLGGAGGLPPTVARMTDPGEADALAGIALGRPGLWFPQGGRFAPADICRLALDADGIELHCGTRVDRLHAAGGGWTALDADGQPIDSADICVIASAWEALRLGPASNLPLRTVGGQVSMLPADGRSAALRAVICAEGFLLPAANGVHGTGSTYRQKSTDSRVLAEDHRRNIERMLHLSADLDPMLERAMGDIDSIAGRAGVRAVMRDYLPAAGLLEDGVPGGLYASIGHGSRGLAWTALCADIIASTACGEPLPLEQDLVEAVSPRRFAPR